MESKRMKTLIGVTLAVLAALAQPALAGPGRDLRGGLMPAQMQRAQPGQFQRAQPGQFQRQPNPDFRRPERPPEQGQRPNGRLTDEERRDLHRDLDRANREIYKGQQR
jgi:hypothetical protein